MDMDSVSQSGEKRFYNENKRMNGYNYRSDKNDYYRGKNSDKKRGLKQETSRQNNVSQSGTFNSLELSDKDASANCIIKNFQSKEKNVLTSSSVNANSVVPEKLNDKCQSNMNDKNVLNCRENQSQSNKPGNALGFRGRGRNVYNNRRRQHYFNESNEGVRENGSYSFKNSQNNRYGNNSKPNNYRGDLNYGNVNNQRSHFQYRKYPNSFPSYFNNRSNNVGTEKSSDAGNKPQRTYFKKSGKNVPKGNPLGMFWPKLSPLKESEMVSNERPDSSSLTSNKDTNSLDLDICSETGKHSTQHVLNSPSVKANFCESSETVLPTVNASNEGSKNILDKTISVHKNCRNSPYVNRKLPNGTVPSDECSFKRTISDMTSDDESCLSSQKCILMSSNVSNELVNDSSRKSCADDFKSVKGNSDSKGNVYCDYSTVTAKNSASSNHSNYGFSENSDASSTETASKFSVNNIQVEAPNSEGVHSRSDKGSLNRKLSGNSTETNDRHRNQHTGRDFKKAKNSSTGNPDPSKEKQGKLSDQKSPHNKTKDRPKKGPKFNTYYINLDFKDSFFLQAMNMISQFEMSPHERSKVDLLMDDLQWVFTFIIPNAQPVLFGSVVAGTSFKNSDVDIYLQCYDSLPSESVKDFILHYGSAIHKRGCFRNVVKIANARVPIVKAIHNETGMKVDVSFVVDRSESHYGLCNSLLVKHLCSYDYRVRNLIMLVLFWAKCHGFVGKYQMSSFTFILLAVFYLQIVEILPPLHKLIRVSEDATSWPNTFNEDTKLLINNNTESLESLYLGFFTFFSAVRFDEVVISVYAGELVLGALFETMELLPECYVGYRRLVQAGLETALVRNDMCIQEPFNMSWNTVRSLNTKNVELLKQGCQNVCNIFTKFSLNRALYVVHSDYQHLECEEDSYYWELPCPSGTGALDWFKKVLKATKTIFTSILLMDVHFDSDKTDDSKFCQFGLYGTEIENPVKMTVSSEYIVTVKERSKIVKAYKSKCVSNFEKEVKASNLLLEDLKKKEKPTRFSAIVYIARNEKNDCVEVSVNSCSKQSSKIKKNDHKQFVSFLKNDHFKYFLSLTMELDQPNKATKFGSVKSED